MRQTLMVATMAVMMSCSPDGTTPWDENRDGLITACEGLNSYACDSTPGCEPVPTRCAGAALTDGTTVPCVGAETCQPTTPPIFDCSHLTLRDCATVARCEVVTRQPACDSDTPTGVGFAETDRPAPAPVPPVCGQAVQVCANRAPTACEQLSNDVCLAQPGCALQGFGATCDVACSAESFSCPPCATQLEHCVTLPPPDVCGARDPNTCALDGRCVLETADYRCEASAPCAPGATNCGAPRACAPPAPRCVPAPPPDLCGSRDENTCSIDGRCMLEMGICDAVCRPDGSCPCDPPSARCVPVPVPDVCSTRDLNTCTIDGQCTLQSWACPAVCEDDGQGGCLPCDAPPAACVPAFPPLPPSRCEGLDRLSCASAGCEVIELGLACPAVCQDDGNGGCLPCKDFVCNDPTTSGGGTRPPQP